MNIKRLLDILQKNTNKKNWDFMQVLHQNICISECNTCYELEYRIFENGTEPELPLHPRCDCYYEEITKKAVGSISQKGLNSPDVWLKLYGILPNYYITKQEAIEIYGWNSRRNTMAGKAPGLMIGGDIYRNDNLLLPNKPGRIWYECDVDYESGGRSAKRLYYSNDGLMFFTIDHGKQIFYQVK